LTKDFHLVAYVVTMAGKVSKAQRVKAEEH